MNEWARVSQNRLAIKSYDLGEIEIVPVGSDCGAGDVDISWSIGPHRLGVPLIAHPSDALVGPDFAVEMHRQGGLAVLDGEGLLGRYADVQQAIDGVLLALEYQEEKSFPSDPGIVKLQQLYEARIDEGLLSSRISQVRAAGATVAVRVSRRRLEELAPVVVAAGAQILVVQEPFIAASDLPVRLDRWGATVIVGGVPDYANALELMRAGADGVLVGDCNQYSSYTLGVRVGLATAIAEVARARDDYLAESGGRYVSIIAEGYFPRTGAMAVALALGADAVMLGSALASCEEAQAQGYFWQSSLADPRLPLGGFTWASQAAARPSLRTVIHGPSTEADGRWNMAEALRRAVAIAGGTSIRDLHEAELTFL